MGRKIVLFLWLMLCLVATVGAADRKFTLVIDAGHGGHDAGALGAFSKEKNINLNVALAFGRYVEKNCPDVRVIYTRKTDVFIALHERANIANRNKADLFISIHTNALPKGRIARGLETYTLGMNRASDNFDVAARENSVILVEKDYKQRYEGFDPRSSESYIMFEFMQDKNMAQSVDLAKVVQKRACAATGRQNKGVKQAGFLVLRETSMPSCLIELGFITTPDEERYLNSASGIDALGKGIYQAFLDYKSKYDKTVTVPYKADTNQKVSIPAVVPQEAKASRTVSKRDKRRSKVAATPVQTSVTPVQTASARNGASGGAKTVSVRKNSSKSIIAELSDARNGMVNDTSAEDAAPAAGTERMSEEAVPVKPVSSEGSDTKSTEVKAAATKPAGVKATDVKATDVKLLDTKAADVKSVDIKPVDAKTSDEVKSSETKTSESGTVAEAAVPVFKVQIMASNRNLGADAAVFKGLDNVGYYEEGGLYKFTYGASADYNEIVALRKGILDKFPEAFVVAFKDGQKINVAEAIREFKNNRNKR